MGTAIAVLSFAESFATTSGLGYYVIVETWGRLAYDQMYAGVVAMSLLGLGLLHGRRPAGEEVLAAAVRG